MGRPAGARRRSAGVGLLTAAASLTFAGCGSARVSRVPVPTSAGTAAPVTARTPATGGVSTAAGTAAPGAGGRCGTLPRAPAYTHVVWVWMENHSYDGIVGNRSAPYLNSLVEGCGLATNYHSLTHPSLPNYVGATSGLALPDLGRFAGDCSPSSRCSTPAQSIFGQGETWKAYEESMPSNCHRSDAGGYAVRHNPPPYFSTLSGCAAFDVPFTHLAGDLADDTLPAFSFVTPDVFDDMHDGSVRAGDDWLSRNLPMIFDSAPYRRGTTAVFVTWDEGSDDHVATIVASPSTAPGTRSGVPYDHYSLLGTAEELLGLPKLGRASSSASMTAAFDL